MYLPPGTMKIKLEDQILFSKILVVRECGISALLKPLEFCRALQISIHLRGAMAARSSSKSLISGIEKLGRKRALSRHT